MPPLYNTPGKQTIAAVPFVACHDNECMINARSALDFRASTPAGENLVSFISVASSSPTHYIEYGGFDTMTSKTLTTLIQFNVLIYELLFYAFEHPLATFIKRYKK